MTSLERYASTVAGEAPDRLCCVPILMQFAAEYIGSNYAAFASDYRVLVEASARCAEAFGFDQVSAISDPYRETEGFGGVLEFPRDSAPQCPTPPLAADRDLSRLRSPDPMTSARMHDRVRAVETFRDRCGGRLSILGWVEGPAAEAADLRGVCDFLMDLAADESYACALMDRCLEAAIAFAEAQIAAGADTVGIGDAIASQVGPDLYERLIQPREAYLVNAIRDAGAWVKLHICGDITALLPAIADLGVDILDVDHMVDLSAAREAVGTGVVLTGNLDPVGGILRGVPQGIAQAVRSAYERAGFPYMVNAGCEIPAGTPDANLAALCGPQPC